jgi:hypothetical protein
MITLETIFGLEVVLAIIGCIQAVAVAFLARNEKKRKAREDKNMAERKAAEDEMRRRAVQRAEESLLNIQLMSASVRLGMASAIAIQEGKTNGMMTAALEEASKAESAYDVFIRRIAAKEVLNDG